LEKDLEMSCQDMFTPNYKGESFSPMPKRVDFAALHDKVDLALKKFYRNIVQEARTRLKASNCHG